MKALALTLLLAAAGSAAAETNAELEEQVRQAEIAFAKSMADRDHAAFVAHLADDAIFVGRAVTRGKQAVADKWKPLYEGAKAPFSWAPETVAVVENGTLGLSTGPVFGPDGKRTGQYNSTWRREKDGKWKIVLDNGCKPCECGEEPKPAAAPAPSPKP